MIAGGVLGTMGSLGGTIISAKGDLSLINWNEAIAKAAIMGLIGVALGKFTGAGANNVQVMNNAINASKSWGSKMFLNSAKEVALRLNSGLTVQTMYVNMAKAIMKYKIQAMVKVSGAIIFSTFIGNL